MTPKMENKAQTKADLDLIEFWLPDDDAPEARKALLRIRSILTASQVELMPDDIWKLHCTILEGIAAIDEDEHSELFDRADTALNELTAIAKGRRYAQARQVDDTGLLKKQLNLAQRNFEHYFKRYLEVSGKTIQEAEHEWETKNRAQPNTDQAREHPIFKFLLGEGELCGSTFGGERPPMELGNFWWRKHLREALASRPGVEESAFDPDWQNVKGQL